MNELDYGGDLGALIGYSKQSGIGALLQVGSYQNIVDIEHDQTHEYRSSIQLGIGTNIDQSVNRQIWNRLVAELLTADDINLLRDNWDVAPSDLEPLLPIEVEMVHEVLEYAYAEPKLPNPIINCLDIEFKNARFAFPLFLDGFIFENLKFVNCDFGEEFSLDSAKILGSLSFERCNFSKNAYFSSMHVGSRQGGVAEFVECQFKGDTEIGSSHFKNEACFTDTSFFGETTFHSSIFRYRVLCINTQFKSTTSFENVSFMREAPHMFAASIHENTNFDGALWPTYGKGIDAHQNVRNYERLKLIMGSQGKFRQEHKFLRLEMKSHEAAEGFASSIPSLFFGFFSNYGWSYTRPIWSILAIGLLGWTLLTYLVCDANFTMSIPAGSCTQSMLAVSFSNMFSFLGLGRTFLKDEIDLVSVSSLAEIASVVQFILGPMMIFFFGLALRNRFRMK